MPPSASIYWRCRRCCARSLLQPVRCSSSVAAAQRSVQPLHLKQDNPRPHKTGSAQHPRHPPIPPSSRSSTAFPTTPASARPASAHRSFPSASPGRSSVWSWGAGVLGGLGCGSYRPHAVPTVIPALSSRSRAAQPAAFPSPSLSPIVSVASGWTTNVAISASGSVWQWGHQPFLRPLAFTVRLHNWLPAAVTALQSLGLGRFSLSNASTVPQPLLGWGREEEGGGEAGSHVAVSASCGGDFSAVVDSEGGLWTMGSNFFGQCGHPGSMRAMLLRRLQRVESLQYAGMRVRAVSCGFHHLLLLMDDGSVWVCGKHDHGQLGIGAVVTEGKRLFHPHLVPGTAASPQQRLSLDPRQLDEDGTVASLPTPPAAIGPVAQVSAGMKHSLLLAEDGSVWATGLNQFGQCGFPPLEVETTARPQSASPASAASASTFLSVSSFTRISALKHERIVQLSAGQHHSLFLAASGTVYACGLNSQGQCGRPYALSTVRQAAGRLQRRSHHCVPLPSPVLGLQGRDGWRCGKVRAGFYDSAMIGDDGSLAWCGLKMREDRGGRPLGTEDVGAVEELMPGRRLRDVSFGLKHALLLTEDEDEQQPAAAAAAAAAAQSGSGRKVNSDPRPSWY